MAVELRACGNRLELESEPTGRIALHGSNCTLRVGRGVTLDASIVIQSDVSNAVIEIGDGCAIGGMIRLVRGDGSRIVIGEGTTFNQVGVSMHEAGQITFGRGCMLSTDIHMDVSDMHPIYDRYSGERLNPPQDIRLGDRVWLGSRVLVLKGADIGSGTVVGAGAMVAGALPQNVLAIGSPARVVRENIVWARDIGQAPELCPPPGAPDREPWWQALPGKLAAFRTGGPRANTRNGLAPKVSIK
jgi:acetyltransferase-like isoleucine patch superfamily enzyme